MDEVEAATAAFEEIRELLNHPELAPDPERADWRERSVQLDEVVAGMHTLLQRLEPVMAQSEEEAAQWGSAAVGVAWRAAGLLHAGGRGTQAREVLTKCEPLPCDDEDRALLAAGRSEIVTLTRLAKVYWLWANDRIPEAQTLARSFKEQPFSILAQRVLEIPDAIKAAPTMFTWNGCGLSIYGSRDAWADGSFVTTRYVTLVFLPIIPVDAYRVFDCGGGSYSFVGKVPLKSAWRVWQIAVAALVVVGGLGWGVSEYLSSPSRQIAVALSALQKNDAKDPAAREELIRSYQDVIGEWEGKVNHVALQPAAEAVARLALEGVPDPFGPAHVDAGIAALADVAALPEDLREGVVSKRVVARVEAWLQGLGSGSESNAVLALRLAAAAPDAMGAADAKTYLDKKEALELAFADRMSKEFPAAALRITAGLLQRPEALAKTSALFETIADEPSLLLELEPEIKSFAAVAQGSATARKLEQALADAKSLTETEERKALLAEPEEKALREASAQAPKDQGLAVALAELLIGQGEAAKAKEVLRPLGTPGRMVLSAQLALVRAHIELEEDSAAEGMLTRMLAVRLPAYEAAASAYSRLIRVRRDQYFDDVNSDNISEALKRRLEAVPEADRLGSFNEWISEQLEADPVVTEARERFTRMSDVVPVAIMLGTVNLRRASNATGSERQDLLAAAERAFLAIQGAGAGYASYHLGLGQVYHRLGKTEDGERELGALLEKNDPDLSLDVARAYRELGMESRTREVCKQVFDAGDESTKQKAAILLSLIARTRAERVEWLRRADQKDDFVRTGLLSAEGDALLAQGKLEEADAKFAVTVAGYEKNATLIGSAANNAALALGSRYECTGDRRHIDRAVVLMERARGLAPDNAVMQINTAGLLEHRGLVKVLSGFVDERATRLDTYDAQSVTDAMLGGPLRERVLAALKASPDIRRAMDVRRQVEVLSPGAAHAYLGQSDWFERLEDRPALLALRDRLAAVKSIDAEASLAERKRFVAGELDAERKETLLGSLERAKLLQAPSNTGGDKKSLAALRFLEAGTRRGLSTLAKASEAEEHARLEVEALRHADELWPELGARRLLVPALLRVALLRTQAKSPALLPDLHVQLRELDAESVFVKLCREQSTSALAALAAEPQLAEVLTLRKEQAQAHPRLVDFAVAKALDDSALLDLAKPALKSSRALVIEIDERVIPTGLAKARMLGLAWARTL